MPRKDTYTADVVLERLREWRLMNPKDPTERLLAARLYEFWRTSPEERVAIARIVARLANSVNKLGPVGAFETVDSVLRRQNGNAR